MHAIFATMAILGLMLGGCSDPPIDAGDGDAGDVGCTINGTPVAAGQSVVDPVSCQTCLCSAGGGVSCALIPGCVPGGVGFGGSGGADGVGGAGPGGADGAGGVGGMGGADGFGGAGGADGVGGMGEGGGGGEGGGEPGCSPGRVTGLACAPNGTPIAGARIYAETADCDGRPVTREVFAGDNGNFSLDGLAPGPTTVMVSAGSFEGVYDVVVIADRSVPLDERADKECLGTDAAAIAVVSGEFDSIETIVGGLGFELDLYCGGFDGNYGARALFGQWDLLSQYDVIFLNCGLTIDFSSREAGVMVQNLRRFVSEGGSLYISDLAANVIEAVWPQKVQFRSERFAGFDDGDPCCTCIDCPPQCNANAQGQQGACMGTIQGGGFCEGESFGGFGNEGVRRATVNNASLQQFLGRNTLDVRFDVGGWVEINSTAPDVEVLVSDGREPLMVVFNDGEGRVAFTTFHNEDQAAADVQKILQALIFQL